jgi:DNA-binding IclR family transcriptional regulator
MYSTDQRSEKSRYFNQSVERAIAILGLFLDDMVELSATEISKRLSLPQSTIFRFLVTLEALRLIERNPENNKYRLGVMCLELGTAFLKNHDLRQQSLPILQSLRDTCGETVHLGVLENFYGVYIEKLSGLHSIGFMSSQLGGHFPLYCTGLGKSLLANLSEDQKQNYLDHLEFQQFTQNTITDPQQLSEELEQIRRLGYATDKEEHENGVACIASPIFKHNGLAGAISIAGPASRIHNEDNFQKLARLVKDAAKSISARLAGRSN